MLAADTMRWRIAHIQVALAASLLLGSADAARAWNDTGHQIIALIA